MVASQNYVSEFELRDYPISEADILHRGRDAWNAALNTVNIGKYNLGWASIGICTHALYEAITTRTTGALYGMHVTDMSHVRRMFVDAYARLVAMKLFALRAADYMRVASPDDRRYLLYNPMVKMKVTTQGEDVIDLLWDAIAAKGFEKDMYFEQAAVDIRALPKLEGTVHVNIALIVKFMPNYFFNPGDYPEVGSRPGRQRRLPLRPGRTEGSARSGSTTTRAFERFDLPNVRVFCEQIEPSASCFAATARTGQMKDVDFLLAGGEIFALVVYAQLILENAPIYDDRRRPARPDLRLHGPRLLSARAQPLLEAVRAATSQMAACREMIRKPVCDEARYKRVWQEVLDLQDEYEMAP